MEAQAAFAGADSQADAEEGCLSASVSQGEGSRCGVPAVPVISSSACLAGAGLCM